MIFPCIDLMDGKVVQLIRGREKALEGGTPEEMLERFKAFPQLQVIDLDAAIGRGSNDTIVRFLASRAACRVGGGVRSLDRAKNLMDQGAHKIIVGTSAFNPEGVRHDFLEELRNAVGREHLIIAVDSYQGHIVVKGWRESTTHTAEEVLSELEPYCSGFLCTYVDQEGTMLGTDLDWFRRLRAATALELTAAGGISTLREVQDLASLNVNTALGMAIYTGKLSLDDLAKLNSQST